MDTDWGVQPTQKHAKFKEEVASLALVLKKELQKKTTFLVIWSTREERWDVFC